MSEPTRASGLRETGKGTSAGARGAECVRLGTSGFPGVGLDDLSDARAVLWPAGHILRGEAERVPHDPPSDSLGLLMEIVY